MGNDRKRVFGILFFGWLIWGSLFSSVQLIKAQIPETMRLYEEEAVSVLSGTQKKLTPQQLHLDFAGNIEFRRKTGGTYQAVCQLFGIIPLTTMEVEVVSKQELLPGGIPVGVYVQTDGIFVIGTGDIITEQGSVKSPAEHIVKTGDYITSFQGEPITRKGQLIERLQNFQGEELILGIRRNQEELQVSIQPVYQDEKCYIGIWVRDDTQGIGTLTFVTEEGNFAALGHGISDTDSDLLMEVSGGKLYNCEIIGITKGKVGAPGKLSGKIVYQQNYLLGQISGNLSGGIYGKANERLMESLSEETLPIALKQEVREGEATILSSVDGSLQEYQVEIRKIYRGEKDVNKGMEIVVTDERLLELTGGIVQGMSGSPICQNGKIVGAVTHVLVNDPTRGYGIFIENMLEHN